MKVTALLLLVAFFVTGCATGRGIRDGIKEDTHNFFGKAHRGVMKADKNIRDHAW